jgi:hypothetical protein
MHDAMHASEMRNFVAGGLQFRWPNVIKSKDGTDLYHLIYIITFDHCDGYRKGHYDLQKTFVEVPTHDHRIETPAQSAEPLYGRHKPRVNVREVHGDQAQSGRKFGGY